MSKFKIQGVVLDTTSIIVPDNLFKLSCSSFDYIMTSIPANNDHVLRGLIIMGGGDNSSLITYTDHLGNIEDTVKSHLREIIRDSVDLLLVDLDTADWGNLGGLKELINGGTVKHLGIRAKSGSQGDLGKVLEWLDKEGVKAEFLDTTICPLEFDLELLEFAEKKGLQIIASNPYGDPLSSARNIRAFSKPYLLSFAAAYGDLVSIGSEYISTHGDIEEDEISYLKKLVGKDTEDRFILKKSMFRPVKEIKQVIHTSIQVDNDDLVPYANPEYLTSPEYLNFKLGSWNEDVKFPDSPKDEIVNLEDLDKLASSELEQDLQRYVGLLSFPDDAGKNSKFAIARYKIVKYLGKVLPNYTIDVSGVVDSVRTIIATEIPTKMTPPPSPWKFWKWASKPVETKLRTKQFILIISGNGEKIKIVEK